MQTLKKYSRCLVFGLTPLIDVVFILIVFFLLSSNFTKWNTLYPVVPKNTQQASYPLFFLVFLLTAGNLGLLKERGMSATEILILFIILGITLFDGTHYCLCPKIDKSSN